MVFSSSLIKNMVIASSEVVRPGEIAALCADVESGK